MSQFQFSGFNSSQFQFLGLLLFRFLSFSEIEFCQNLSCVPIWVFEFCHIFFIVLLQFEFCHNFNFWILSQFKFLSFVIICVFCVKTMREGHIIMHIDRNIVSVRSIKVISLMTKRELLSCHFFLASRALNQSPNHDHIFSADPDFTQVCKEHL